MLYFLLGDLASMYLVSEEYPNSVSHIFLGKPRNSLIQQFCLRQESRVSLSLVLYADMECGLGFRVLKVLERYVHSYLHEENADISQGCTYLHFAHSRFA
jgi:hypothetical protein